MRTLKHYRATLLQLAAVIVLFPSSGWSLCLGPDGHFELEPVARAEQPCCESGSRSENPDACVPDGCDHCDDCIDLALSAGPALRSKLHESTSPSTVVTAAPTIFTLAAPRLERLPSRGTPPRHASPVATTILRR